MGLFGNINVNFCPLCGDKIGITGGQPLVDGAVCAMCWQKFRAKSQADMSQMTIEQVNDIIEGTFENEITGQPCPVCGRPMDSSARPIADAVICSACERMERAAYFITDEGDELDDLTLAYACEDYNLNRQHINETLEKAPSDSVSAAYVDESFEDGSKTVILIAVAKGDFNEKDEIVLVHEDTAVTATIKRILAATGKSYEDSRGQMVSDTLAGSDCGWIVLQDTEAVYEPGDYIYKR